jgi:hypothetical protein
VYLRTLEECDGSERSLGVIYAFLYLPFDVKKIASDFLRWLRLLSGIIKFWCCRKNSVATNIRPPKYRVFTKEWCGFKNLLNDYILQLDGAPQSCSPTALDRTCCKWRQPHTHAIWYEFDYRVDVSRVTQGPHIEGLCLMHKEHWQLPLLTVYVLPA